MNTPTDLQWIFFATVPVNGYAKADPVMTIARGIRWLYRRLVDGRRRDSSGAVTSRKDTMVLRRQPVRRLP